MVSTKNNIDCIIQTFDKAGTSDKFPIKHISEQTKPLIHLVLNELPLTLQLEDKQRGYLKTKEDVMRQLSALFSFKSCKKICH